MSQDSVIPPGPAAPRRSSTTGVVVPILVILYALALGLSVALVVTGRHEAVGITGVLAVLTLAPVAFVTALSPQGRALRQLNVRVDELYRCVRDMSDHAALSNDARRVLNRQGERDLLRRAIEEDVANRNWDAAMVLVKELAEGFGYRADAEEFRRRIEQARSETLDREVTEAVAYLDGLIIQRRWEAAYADAARIQRLFPYSPRVEGLRVRVQSAQEAHKADLERRFLVAAQEGRVDDALALLKELDNYLTPQQAEPLRELARGVIGKARDNLGAQFKLAVQDRRWREAARIGERIIDEFPNSRMAGEVRDVIDGVRARAAGASPAA